MSNDPENHSAWSYLKELGVGERHFNEVESKYRALASTWLPAAFEGMGFIATSNNLPVPKETVVFAISVAGTVGIELRGRIPAKFRGADKILLICEVLKCEEASVIT